MIRDFIGVNDFLNNFYIVPVYYEGLWFPSSEHAYQAAKSMILSERISILKCNTPGQAKRMGKKLNLRPGWGSMRFDVMLEIVKSKFKDPRLMYELSETFPHELIEGNNWHDNFWGDCSCEKCQSIKGLNYLGLILMTTRSYYKGDSIESILCD